MLTSPMGCRTKSSRDLARDRRLEKSISRTSVLQYKSGVSRNLREIAQQTGVANV